ncbi:MAG: preprotein translocase subunit SecA, partial [Oligoflexia bacterium]|nr:preprotein translocase subunit SecA [Oligoflexia bacterium]
MIDVQLMINKVLGGTRSDRVLKKFRPLVSRINGLEAGMQALSDEELRAFTPDFRQRLENGASEDDLLPEAFAVVREVGRRTMEMRHFDVQLLGGIVLHRGSVAEMKTGEGKTLVATLPVYLNALSGKGVHVVTVNDYLAARDADWMGTIYNFLGMSVGKVLSEDRDQGNKQRAYGCDITYGTNNEYGFDYLRDNMKFSAEEFVQRGHHFAIVDEVDSILIDEARTPLIISGPSRQDVEQYTIIDGVVPLLQADIDYVHDEKDRSVALTDAGVDRVEEKLGIDNLYDSNNMEILHHVMQALKAHTVFKRDRDYVVQQGKVVIVDEHTGRLMVGRRWSDGLHQAVEAKEKVNVEPESQTYATITFQNYFRMYKKLSGMTGTAETEAEEFQNIYNLDCLVIPTDQPVIRKDNHDIVYKTQSEKFRAVMAEIEETYNRGQPILVGTTSVEKSELVSKLLRHQGVPHEVLNARNHAREAEIVSQAGRKGAITISTNMAGRGTDIKLGGDPDAMARHEAGPGADAATFQATLTRFLAQCEAEKREVLELGGLHILGTERHESRRIDNQLRGRAGRQGDPGSSRFYLSLEDDLLRVFGSEKIIGWMERMGLEDNEPIEHRWITKSIENAQKKVEGHNFNARKNLLEYDDVMNLQRKSVYEMRRKALQGEDVREMVLTAIENLVDDIIEECAPEGVHPEAWNIEALRKRMHDIFDLEWEESDAEMRDFAHEEMRSRILDEAQERYKAKEEELGADAMRQVERMLLLQFADQFWKDHLLAMDRLRTGIGLRGYGQRNPLLEYKKEGTSMFLLMNSLRDEAVVSRVLRLDLSQQRPAAAPARPAAPPPAATPGQPG